MKTTVYLASMVWLDGVIAFLQPLRMFPTKGDAERWAVAWERLNASHGPFKDGVRISLVELDLPGDLEICWDLDEWERRLAEVERLERAEAIALRIRYPMDAERECG